MAKKTLNQNDKYVQEFINNVEPDFVFSDRPINRLRISRIKNNNFKINKTQELIKLKEQINSIENCNLKNASKSIILGDGPTNSDIMIIGESPGTDENNSGLSFQGEAGALLNKMLLAININREKVYLSYSINFMVPEDRKPTSAEIKRYSSFLKKHISIIDPKIIILMGSIAMQSITGINQRISDERGKWKEIILNNKTYPIMITFSPSYLIRLPDNKKYSWEDLKKIKQKIKDFNIKI